MKISYSAKKADEIPNAFAIINAGSHKKTDRGFKKLTVMQGRKNTVIYTGLGREKERDAERVREAFGAAVKQAKALGAEKISVQAEKGGLLIPQAEGIILASYTYEGFKSSKSKGGIKEVIFCGTGKNSRAVSEAALVCGNVNLARTLSSTPANIATPSFVARLAKNIGAKTKGLNVSVITRSKAKELKMGAFYAVSKGSDEDGKIVVLSYNRGGKKAPVVFIGKGITFDSGGISIKPSMGMEKMKYDMSGASAVLHLMKTIAELKLKVNVRGVLPLAENLPSGRAYKPGDVIRSMSGKTIEIISTDAEGRMVLCDAITYSIKKFRPKVLVDIATLTGACEIALGKRAIGLMSTDDKLSEKMKSAGEKTGERVWRLPLWEEYREQILTKNADIKNTGGRDAGTITAGMFLKEFAGKTPWVHLDIAATAYDIKHRSYVPETGTGVGLRLMLEFLKRI